MLGDWSSGYWSGLDDVTVEAAEAAAAVSASRQTGADKSAVLLLLLLLLRTATWKLIIDPTRLGTGREGEGRGGAQPGRSQRCPPVM